MPAQHNAFISGAGRNIGRAVAMELARRGCNIVINGSSNRANCEAVAAQVARAGREARRARWPAGLRWSHCRVSTRRLQRPRVEHVA